MQTLDEKNNWNFAFFEVEDAPPGSHKLRLALTTIMSSLHNFFATNSPLLIRTLNITMKTSSISLSRDMIDVIAKIYCSHTE